MYQLVKKERKINTRERANNRGKIVNVFNKNVFFMYITSKILKVTFIKNTFTYTRQ